MNDTESLEKRPATAVIAALQNGALDSLFEELPPARLASSLQQPPYALAVAEARTAFVQKITGALSALFKNTAGQPLLSLADTGAGNATIEPATHAAIVHRQIAFSEGSLEEALAALKRCASHLMLGEILAQAGNGTLGIQVVEHIAIKRTTHFLTDLIRETLDLIADNPEYSGNDIEVQTLLMKLREVKTIANLHLNIVRAYDRSAEDFIAEKSLDIKTKIAQANTARISGLEMIEVIIEAQLAPIPEHPKARANLKNKITKLREKLRELKDVLKHTRLTLKSRSQQ